MEHHNNDQAAAVSLEMNFFNRNAANILQNMERLPTEDYFRVTNCDIIHAFISIFLRIISIFATINVILDYYKHEQYNYFVWTLCCFVLPITITTCLQIFIYIQDSKVSSYKANNYWNIFCYIIIIPFLFRYFQSVSYAIQTRNAEKRNNKTEQKRFYELMVNEDSDVALIRIFECFLEAAPQKILQITIILTGEVEVTVSQVLSITSSMFSMGWCLASYHKSIRFSQIDKFNISLCGSIIQTLWNFLVTLSRVLSIAVVASLFPKWTLIGCSVHAIIMAFWIFLFDSSPFCSSTILNSLAFSIILGLVFIFNYILPKSRQTRYRYTVFYIICFLENIACVTIYILWSDDETRQSFYFIPLCFLAIVPFMLGIIFMIIYYTQCHPNIIVRKNIAKQNDGLNENL